MRLKNIIQINDWKIRDFFSVILTIQASVLSLLILHALGLDLRNEPLFQLVTFLYVTFVPGFLILRILRLHKLGNIRALLFAMGLSTFSVMMTGLSVNMFLPLVGFSRPISYGIIVTAMFILVSGLSYLCYARDRDFNDPDFLSLKDVCDRKTLLLLALPVLSIFSTTLMNISGNNVLQMLLLLLIAIIPLLAARGIIDEKYFPLTIFATSLALMFHTSLITGYVWGNDVNHEVFLSNLVMSRSLWDVTIPDTVNAMLSITILSPIYAILMNADVVWVYKIIYPLIFSVVPLGLYYVVKRQTDASISFFTMCFFMFFFIFYVEMPALARQEIAELFLMLLIIVIVDSADKKINRYSVLVLSVIFGVSVVISHYGTAYVYAICILISILVYAFPLINFDKMFRDSRVNVILNKIFPALLLIFMVAWFTYVAGSVLLKIGTLKVRLLAISMSDLLNPSATQALGIATASMPLFLSVERYMHLACQLFILIGIVTTIAYNKFRFAREYYLLSVGCLILAIAGFVLPHLSQALNSDRLYHLMLFFMAPFLIVGIVNAADIVSRRRISRKHIYVAIAAFLGIFFLFNSAFIYQVFDQQKVGRFALDDTSGVSMAYPDELSAMGWLKNNHNPATIIYSNHYKLQIFVGFFGYETLAVVSNVYREPDISYLFLDKYDIRNSKALNREVGGYLDGHSFNFTRQQQIYDCNECKIFLDYY